MTEPPYWLEAFRQDTEAIRKQTAAIRAETEHLRQQNASLRALGNLNRNPERVKQIVEASTIKPTPMTDYTLEQAVQDFRSIGDRTQKNNETLASNNQKLREMATTLASCHLVSKEDLLDTEAAVRYLGITQPDTIRNWLEGGSFPGAFQSRGQWFFPAVELDKVKRRMDEILALMPMAKCQSLLTTTMIVIGAHCDQLYRKEDPRPNGFLYLAEPANLALQLEAR